MSESIHIQPGSPCVEGGEVKVCFMARDLEIGNSYWVSARCEDATGSCECCNGAFSEGGGGYYKDLTEAHNPVWRDCVEIPAAAWNECVGCGCCKLVLYLNQGEIGQGFALTSVEIDPIPASPPPC